MKKKFLLLLPVIALFGVMAFAFKPVNTFNIAYAETSEVAPNQENDNSQEATSETFQEKVYTYEEEGEAFALTLISETEFTLTDGTDIIRGVYVRENNVVTLNYEGDSLKVVVDDLKGTFGQYEASVVDEVIATGKENIEKTKGVIEEFKNTFLVPLLSGVSIFSLLTTSISITLAVLNKRSNGKIREKMTEVVGKAIDIVDQAVEMKNKATQQFEETKRLANDLKEQGKVFAEQVKDTKEKVEKLYGLKDNMILLAEIEAKKLANEGNAVATGLAEDVNKLVEDTKKLIA